MSSPSKYRVTFSPIRNLEEQYSPSRNLDIILQQSVSSKKSLQDVNVGEQKYSGRSYLSDKFSSESYLADKYTAGYTDTRRLLIENNRLKNDNQVISNGKNFASYTYSKQLDIKEKQADDMRRQLDLVRDRYQRENTTLRLENENLKKTLILFEDQKVGQIALLKKRFELMPEQQRQAIRKGYSNDITKALIDLQKAHLLLEQKSKQFQHLSLVCRQNSHEYGQNLQQLITQNNILKNKLMQVQLSTQKQIRQMSARKQLQKSRTQGIISYCKQNTLYIQKQISRLADELLKKNISIQSFNRQVTKYQRLIEDQGKRNDDEIFRLKRQYQDLLKDKQSSFTKLQKQFKLDLAQKKKIQFQLIEKISSLQNQLDVFTKKFDHLSQTLSDRQRVIRDLKQAIQKKQQQHAKQISKVMSDSRVKRKSMKNLSSYSSFKDIEDAQGSSIIKSSNLKRQESLLEQHSQPLPTVREEQNLAKSHGFAEGEDLLDIKELVVHYQSMVQELKRNKMTELSIANSKIQSLKQSLNDKQQQVLDILNRFSPLMQYKISRESIDQQRKRRIEEHQKGDIDLLGIMLKKYDIISLRTK